MVWFKNAQYYTLNELPATVNELTDRLQERAFSPCLPHLPLSMGWVAPHPAYPDEFVHRSNAFLLVCLQVSEKLLPQTIVREALGERMQALEAKFGRPVRGREKNALKENIYQELLPQAFCKNTKIYALIHWSARSLIIDAGVGAKLEYFLQHWAKTLEETQARPFEYSRLQTTFTRWLRTGRLPHGLTLGDTAVLQDPKKQGRVLRCKQQDLFAGVMQHLLNDGLEASQLALSWKEQIRFTLKENFTLTQIQFYDAVLAAAKDEQGEQDHPALRFDADCLMMAETLQALFADLCEWFKVEEAEMVV